MKETPIIMSGNHPNLILDGTKTMTRRVIKPQPKEWQISQDIIGLEWKGRNLGSLSRDSRGSIAENYLATLCPYGHVGDRLWMRETFNIIETVIAPSPIPDKVVYKASPDTYQSYPGIHWRPSIHMPRWASRITLEITEVRVERVQEISDADIEAEGLKPCFPSQIPQVYFFKDLWDSLNAKRGYGWESNPWIWVLNFKVVK